MEAIWILCNCINCGGKQTRHVLLTKDLNFIETLIESLDIKDHKIIIEILSAFINIFQVEKLEHQEEIWSQMNEYQLS